jgi:hypothetical protein
LKIKLKRLPQSTVVSPKAGLDTNIDANPTQLFSDRNSNVEVLSSSPTRNLLSESKKQYFVTENKPKRQSIFSHNATTIVKKTIDLPSLRSSSGDLSKSESKTNTESKHSSEQLK